MGWWCGRRRHSVTPVMGRIHKRIEEALVDSGRIGLPAISGARRAFRISQGFLGALVLKETLNKYRGWGGRGREASAFP
jgi:hypothetical protein